MVHIKHIPNTNIHAELKNDYLVSMTCEVFHKFLGHHNQQKSKTDIFSKMWGFKPLYYGAAGRTLTLGFNGLVVCSCNTWPSWTTSKT